MSKKASTHGASAPSKSKTARSKPAKAKSKDKAAPRMEARKAASEAASKRTASAAKQGGSPRRSRSHSLSPDDRPNPRFAYRDHSPGAESPVFDISMITGSESDGDSPGSTKDPSSSQDAPSQDAPADDAESSEAKADSTSSPAKNLTLDEASAKLADEGAASAKKRAAPGSPTSEPSIAKGFKSLFDSSDEEEEEGAVSEPREISNDLDEQQERYQAAQLQGTPVPPTPVYPRGYYPPDAGCVLLTPHRIPLKEFTSLRKKPEDRGGLFPVWGYPWRQLHSVMEGLRQQSKSSAQDERGYGSVNPGTVHRKASKKPRTTYAPAPSGSQPGAGLPAPTSSVTKGNLAALGRPAPHGSGARRSDQGGQEELSH
ncbi:ATP-binding cassette (ABC) Superfamily, partial [Phytophthora palmivora]